MDARRVFDAARLRITLEFPYLSAAVWALRGPLMVKGLSFMAGGAIGVDAGWRIYLDPDLEWTVSQLATALRHEVWHCLRTHADRRGARCPRRWNFATDLSVNSDMAVERPAPDWPYPGLHPSQFGLPEHLVEEEYYELLPKKDHEQEHGGEAGGGSGSCGGTGDADASTPSQPKCEGCGMCGGTLGVGSSPSPGGSASDGVPRVWEQHADGSVREVTGAEADAIRRQVAEQVREASKMQGNIPAGAIRWADSHLEPAKVPWQQVLRGAVRAALARKSGAVDYDRSRLSRRQATLHRPGEKNVLYPRLYRPTPHVAVVIDTSGSMSDEQLHMALAEVQGVITGSGADEVAVVTCDAVPYDPQVTRRARDIELQGGGGTDMPAGLEACKKLRPRPDIVVVLTDGYTGWGTDSPPFRTIVCLLGDHAERDSVPSWATVVEVNE